MSVAKSIRPSSVILIRGVNPSVPYISAETPVTSRPILNLFCAESSSCNSRPRPISSWGLASKLISVAYVFAPSMIVKSEANSLSK